MKVLHISTGGPEYDIQVDGKRYHFEMHPACGPVALDEQGNEVKEQPERFLYAVTQWAKQGRKVEAGLCVWHHDPKPIREHLIGRQYVPRGYLPAVKGE